MNIEPKEKLKIMRQAELNPGLALLTIIDILQRQIAVLVDQKMTQIESTLPEKVVLKHIKKLKGEKGDTGAMGKDGVDREKLVSFVLSKIPKPVNGHTPTDKELLKIITPLIASSMMKNIPSKDELLAIIRPLIPVPEEIVPDDEYFKDLIAMLLPKIDNAGNKEILEKLKSLQDQMDVLSKLPRSAKTKEKRYLHGGGPVLSAGTGVTITFDDNGVATISSSGGGGFTKLSATEPVDGSRKIFTFATASIQPSLLVSDGVELTPLDQTVAQNVQWTWNEGLLQATMTTPPQFSIFAIK